MAKNYVNSGALVLDGTNSFETETFDLNIDKDLYIASIITVDAITENQTIFGFFNETEDTWVWRFGIYVHSLREYSLFEITLANNDVKQATLSAYTSPLLWEGIYTYNGSNFAMSFFLNGVATFTRILSDAMLSKTGKLIIAPDGFKGKIDFIAIANQVPDYVLDPHIHWGNHIPIGVESNDIDGLIHYYPFNGSLKDHAGAKPLHGTTPKYTQSAGLEDRIISLRHHAKYIRVYKTSRHFR